MPVLPRVKWEAGQRQEFLLWSQRELTQTRADRAPLERKWMDMIEQWRAQLPDAPADFPWPGASNVELPLSAMHADPIYSDLLQSIHGTEDLWHVRARNNRFIKAANPLRKLLTRLDQDFLKMREVDIRAFLDLVVLGTTIYKVHWQHRVRKVNDYDPEERSRIVQRQIVESMPKVEAIPLQHFWIPANAWNIDPDAPVGGARWVAHQFFLTEGQLRAKAESGGRLVEPEYDPQAVDDVVQWITDRRIEEDDGRVDRTIQEQDDYTPFRDQKLELFEFWARFDVDGDGIEEDVVVVLHEPSMTILRALHNPALHGKRPFVDAGFLPAFGFYRIGIAEADEWAQATSSMLLNGLINNVVLANSRMFGVPRGSEIDPNEDVYPGKVWYLGPDEEIGEVRLGEVYPSLPQTINFLIQMSELRTGVSELRQGDISQLPSRTPATTVIETLRLGSKRFDMILGNLRERELGKIGALLIQLFAQYLREDEPRWTRYLTSILPEDDAKLVKDALLGIPPAQLSESFDVTITAATAIANKEAEKQQFLGLIQLLSQIMPPILELTQFIEQMPPGSPSREVAEGMLNGSWELIQRLLERFDIENPEELVPNLGAITAALNANRDGVNPALAQLLGGNGGAPSIGQLEPAAFGFGL